MINALLMSLVLASALGLFAFTMKRRYALMMSGQPLNRFDNIGERVKALLRIGIGQAKMFKDPAPGLMHAVIFWGFCVVSIRSVIVIGRAYAPDLAIPGVIGAVYATSKDVFELAVLVMVGYAFFRRWVTKPARLTQSREAELILAMIATLMITDFIYDGALFSQGRFHEEAAASPIGSLVAGWMSGMGSAPALGTVAYWIHCVTLVAFLNILPRSKHFHVITSLPNVFLKKNEARGALRPVPDLEARVEKGEAVGVSRVEEATWKDLLDMYTCTECGRCEVNCPAWQTGKPLSPKKLIMTMRDNLYEREKAILDKAAEPEERQNVIAAVTDDVIWACTTCRSCEENCPVMIEHVQKIVDMRRHLVLMEASFPKELGPAMRNLEQKSNPWGLSMNQRDAWAKDLAVPHISENPEAEYLYFVGCAGSFDDRAKKVSTALVKILREAGISFAILGKDEGCTGDPARRLGNEYLFKMQAEANIEVFKSFNVRKVITACPHCFNTIKNEYPQLGGNYDVIHHSQLIDALIAEGRIKVGAEAKNEKITYHDACYLGRYNDVYEQPRNAVKALPGADLVEMERNKKGSFCCGAGGGRVFMEEKIGTRVNQERIMQAAATNATTVATACPYCLLMMKDGIAEKGLEEKMVVRDVAELVAERMITKPAAETVAAE